MARLNRCATTAALALGAFGSACGGSSSTPHVTATGAGAYPSPTRPAPTSTPTPIPPRPGRIVFLAQAPAGLVAEVIDWQATSLAGEAHTRGFPYSSGAAISPDGTRVAYVRHETAVGDIFIAEIDGTRHTNLTRSPGDDEVPLWSPEGARLAFISRAQDGSTLLRIIGVNAGAPPATLEPPPEVYTSLAWLPDGSGFSFLAPAVDGAFDLYTLSLDGTLSALTASPDSEVEAAFSIDGRIALVRLPAETPEPSPSLEPGTPATTEPGDEAAITPAPSATPTSTPFPGGDRELWLLAPGESERRLEFPGLSAYSQLRWSPDGHYLSFLARRESGAEALYLLDIDSADGPRVAFARSRVDEWTWAPDSSAIAIVANGGPCGRTCPRGFLHLLDLESGRITTLPDVRVVSSIIWPWE